LKPNLFLVGAAKAGTSSMYRLLQNHPDVFMSAVKEPNFFSRFDLRPNLYNAIYHRTLDINSDLFLKHPGASIHTLDIHTWDQYSQLFDNAGSESIIGEASASYLFCPSAAAQIARVFPEARILIVLRQPADRAWSHYLMNIKIGYSVRRNFLDEIKSDMELPESGWGITSNYFALGLYADQVRRYCELFPSHQIHVILYDELLKRPNETIRALWRFLEILPRSISINDTYVNKAGLPRFERLNRLIRASALARTLYAKAPPRLRSFGESLIVTRRSVPNFPKSCRVELTQLYRDDILKLARLIDKNLDHWLT